MYAQYLIAIQFDPELAYWIVLFSIRIPVGSITLNVTEPIVPASVSFVAGLVQ